MLLPGAASPERYVSGRHSVQGPLVSVTVVPAGLWRGRVREGGRQGVMFGVSYTEHQIRMPAQTQSAR